MHSKFLTSKKQGASGILPLRSFMTAFHEAKHTAVPQSMHGCLQLRFYITRQKNMTWKQNKAWSTDSGFKSQTHRGLCVISPVDGNQSLFLFKYMPEKKGHGNTWSNKTSPLGATRTQHVFSTKFGRVPCLNNYWRGARAIVHSSTRKDRERST